MTVVPTSSAGVDGDAAADALDAVVHGLAQARAGRRAGRDGREAAAAVDHHHRDGDRRTPRSRPRPSRLPECRRTLTRHCRTARPTRSPASASSRPRAPRSPEMSTVRPSSRASSIASVQFAVVPGSVVDGPRSLPPADIAGPVGGRLARRAAQVGLDARARAGGASGPGLRSPAIGDEFAEHGVVEFGGRVGDAARGGGRRAGCRAPLGGWPTACRLRVPAGQSVERQDADQQQVGAERDGVGAERARPAVAAASDDGRLGQREADVAHRMPASAAGAGSADERHGDDRAAR